MDEHQILGDISRYSLHRVLQEQLKTSNLWLNTYMRIMIIGP